MNPLKGIVTPYETCVYSFDRGGIYNMSFEEIAVCHLDAECESPYVEKNVLHCWSEEQGREHNPWEVTRWAETGRTASPMAKRPTFVQNRKQRGPTIWTYLLILCGSSVIIGMAASCFWKSRHRYGAPRDIENMS